MEQSVIARTVISLLRVSAVLIALTLPGFPVAQECNDCHDAHVSSPVHADFDCSDCHAGTIELPHADQLDPADCGACHSDVTEVYAGSVHGVSAASGNEEAADCVGCHGDIHVLLPLDDAASPVHPGQVAETCGGCHSNAELVARYGIDIINPLDAYKRSVHAEAAGNGGGGATCSSCHGSHDTLASADPKARMHRDRVPATCGACHGAISAAYEQSVHGAALARGVSDVPICTDCHGEHRIFSATAAGSPVSPSNQSLQTCGRCHGDVRLSEKYGLATEKVPSYDDSYHGLVVKAGGTTAASCASCHGVHDILPSGDPASHIHPDNLAETCSKCHVGAGTRYTIGAVHVVEEDASFVIVYWIRLIYLVLIFGTIGAMLLHVGLDFIRKFGEPELRALAAAPSSGEERMTRGFRIAHGLVMLSFPILVYSGFALTYPDAWWAWPLTAMGPEFRGLLHRVAAVVIMLALAYHLFHLLVDRKARACIAQMAPSMADWHELRERFRYYVGLRKEPVHSPEVGYIEKAEYLAFWWGMIVMALTGLLLWFENFMLRELPSWVPAAMTAIHFYEAVLASLAILVWHLYWTIFDPAVYPMDLSWLTGKAPASREWERSTPHEEHPGDAADRQPPGS